MITEVILPVLGETMNEGTVVEWQKQVGDLVRRGEPLFSVESDKATLEVESPADGFLREIIIPAETTVPVLTVVALITKEAGEDISNWQAGKLAGSKAEESASQRVSELVEQTWEVSETSQVSERIFASPRARKLAREEGVDLALVSGSGPEGRIVESDIVAYLASVPKVTPVAQRVAGQLGVDLHTVTGTGPGGRITKADVEQATAVVAAVPTPTAVPATLATAVTAETPMSGVRAVIARRMHAGANDTAPVTLTMEVDASQFVALREQLKARLAKQLGFNVGYNDLLIKLIAHALREFPYMNARLDEAAGVIRQLDGVHVALAVDTERGLLVPVVRDADCKGLAEVATELRGVIERARAGTALPDELSGSTFTITNLGMFEIDAFTPIINLPEVAILGVGRIKERPAVVDGEVCVRKLMWLSLTFDHRLVDGAPAARFLQYVKSLVEDPFLWLAATM